MTVQLEHVNYTVSDPDSTAEWMGDVFGWQIRWQGPAINGGRTIHVGTGSQYVALFSPTDPRQSNEDNYATVRGLNHIAVTVDDIEAMEKKVRAAGFKPGNHGDYEPGRRFYFHDGDGIEYEVVQYD